ncbi:MAG: ATP-binding protein [Rhizobiaceae bacterium]
MSARSLATSPLPARILLVSLALLLAAAPFVLRIPAPRAEIVLDEASFSLEGGPAQAVALPHRWPRLVPYGPARSEYTVDFELAAAVGEPMFLIIRAVRQDLRAEVNGKELTALGSLPWLDAAAGTSHRMRLPDGALVPGDNRLVLTLERRHAAVPGYLSRLYLGGTSMIEADYWPRLLGSGRIRSGTHALHLVLIIALATLWTARRQDAAFGWLALIGVSSFIVALPNETNIPSAIDFTKPYFVLTLPAFGLMATGLGYAIAGKRAPRWLCYAIPGLPALLIVLVASGISPRFPAAIVAALLAIATHLGAAIVVVRAYLMQDRWEIGLLSIPFFLTAWYGLRDIAVVSGLVDGAFLLSGFVRPFTMLAILMLLMRRLALSLSELDGANDTLRLRLAEREAELSLLHEKERARTAQSVREQERQRLMHDLHDGLSGHLVSIIALSERKQADPEAIERAAREALNDLRLVINSIDIGDRDLPLALASFRERLEPQLRRLGVDLAWSMEDLPEVSGVTPANALSVLRILQEAVTNALKHGPATRIAIRGAEDGEGAAMIVVENDGRVTAGSGKGHGLANMRRRATLLGGHVALTPAPKGMRLTLTLPLTLAEPVV